MRNTSPGVLLGIGVFLGILIGVVATVVVWKPGTSETYKEYEERMQAERAQPRPQPRDGRDPHAGLGANNPHAAPGGGGPRNSIAKVHFMKKFVLALTETPKNRAPSTSYKPLIKEGARGVLCADCHDPETLNMAGMLKLDPGSEAVEPLRSNPNFMIPLMRKWVGRLNKQHSDRLIKKVTCVDCHAIDPSDFDERRRVYPALMVSFVNALKEPPKNKDPAKGWEPLLKDPAAKSMLCAECHKGPTGKTLESQLGEFSMARPAKYADDKQFMIHLMERWVARANRDLKGQLTKVVTCIDCHDRDPRR